MKKEPKIKREQIISGILAVLFAFFLTAGWRIERGEGHGFPFFLTLYAVLAFLFYRSIGWSFRKMHERELAGAGKERIYSKRRLPHFFLLWAGMAVCWTAALLAAYPGFFCYDATYQFREVANGTYDLHHPLLHTYLLGKALLLSKAYLGSYELGVMLFCVIQMLLITGGFCWVIRFMEKRGIKTWLLWCFYLYYSLYPTCVMFGLCTTKDSIFTACMTLHLLFIFELIQKGREFFRHPKSVALFMATAVFAMLFRNNGIYSYLLFLPLAVLLAKGIRRETVVLVSGCIVAAFLITRLLAALSGAENTDGLREMLSVPAQQLARVHAIRGGGFFNEEERQKLYDFMSEEDLERYHEKLADPVKANLHVGLNSTLPDFIFLWLKTGIRAPEIYMDALLIQTYQAWYPFTIPDGYCGEDAKPRYQDSESCYFALEAEEPVQMDSKFPLLLQGYEWIARHMTFDTAWGVPIVFSIGTFVWLMLYMLGYALCYGKRGAAGMLFMILCICLTCLLGPIVLVRYYLILFYALPIVVAGNKLL